MGLPFKRLLSLMLLLSTSVAWSQMRIISHVTSADGGFATTVIMENSAVDAREYRLQPYDNAGNALAVVSGEIGGQQTLTMDAGDLGDGVSHFTIEANDILVTAAYVARGEGGSPAHVPESSAQATRFRLFAGNWNTVFDGFAVVNTGSEAADVWVAQRNAAGEIVQTVRAAEALAANAKALYIIGQPSGSAFDLTAGNTFEVYAEQPLAITALRSNIPGSTFLWVNETTATGTASTTRDQQGIWFIEDGSLYDVIEMMGYNVAVDRLWQMDLFRRQARGRLSEVFGNFTVDTDRFTRTTNYSDAEYADFYTNMDPEARLLVKAYVDGANRRIAEVAFDSGLRPVEFNLQGQQTIEPFEPIDVLSFVVFMLRQFDPNGFGGGQVSNVFTLSGLQEDFPDTAGEMFNDLVWVNDPKAYTMIPPDPAKAAAFNQRPAPPRLRTDIDFRQAARDYTRMLENRVAIQEALDIRIKGGSYAWVVSGDKTTSGNPIIYSGPQMGFQTPSLTLEGSIRGGGIEISGMTLPLMPLIVIGRTPHHAWSMQVGHAHTADMVMESPDALAGGPHRVETIGIGASGQLELEVHRTENGPIVISDPPVAWKYAHWGYEIDTIEAFLGLARAQSMDEFGENIRKVGVSQHFCYADRDGNIAYWMSGRDPIRPEGDYRLALGFAGEVPQYDLTQVRDLAHDRNNPRGWYGGWNNKAAVDYPNPPFSAFHTYGIFHRAHAVAELLASQDTWTFEEIRQIALNIAATDSFYSGGNPYSFVADHFTEVVEQNPSDDRLAALAIANDWDGHFVDGGTDQWATGTNLADGFILTEQWLDRVKTLTFDDETTDVDDENGFNLLLHMLDESSDAFPVAYDWFSNLDDPEAPQTFEAIVLQALDETIATLGLDQRPWGTDSRGSIVFSHNIFGIQHSMPFASRSTYAHCVEMDSEGPVRIESMFPLGQSGMIYSGIVLDENYLSMTEFFDNFVMRNFPIFD